MSQENLAKGILFGLLKLHFCLLGFCDIIRFRPSVKLTRSLSEPIWIPLQPGNTNWTYSTLTVQDDSVICSLKAEHRCQR